jgi:hypothetical protein
MTCKDTQKSDLAGKTKLTAVTMANGTHKVQRFVWVEHDSHGRAILKPGQLEQVIRPLGIRRGDMFTTG